MLKGIVLPEHMNPTTIDFVRELVHLTSIALIAAVVAMVVIGSIKPHILRRIFREFSERKYIIGTGVFVCLLCGTIFTATQATDNPKASENPKKEIESVTMLPASTATDQSNIVEQPTPAPNTAAPVVEPAPQKRSTPSTSPAQPPAASAPAPVATPEPVQTPTPPATSTDTSQSQDRGMLGNIVCGLFRC